jgi:hypothetical protein
MARWKLLSRHEYEFLSAFPRYVKTLGGLLLGLLMTAGGVAILIFGTDGPNFISGYIFGFLLLGFGLLLAAAMVLTWPWKPVRSVRLYEEGLRWTAGGREHSYPWEDVTHINRTELDVVGSDGRRTDWTREAYLVLRFADGKGVTFDPALSDYSKLARIAQQAATAAQLAQGDGELDADGKQFGPIHVSRKGVTAHGRFFRWKEVKWLAVANGELCAHHACAKWRPVRLNDIPDYLLLLSVVKELGRLRE